MRLANRWPWGCRPWCPMPAACLELVRHGVDGWVVPAGDVDAIHAWLLERLDMPVRPEVAESARLRALACFAMPEAAQRTMALYRKICA